MAEGMAVCALQAVPHSFLLERSFYDERLRPLLTHWALLWLRRNRVQQGSDEHIIAYLSRDQAGRGEGGYARASRATAGDGIGSDRPRGNSIETRDERMARAPCDGRGAREKRPRPMSRPRGAPECRAGQNGDDARRGRTPVSRHLTRLRIFLTRSPCPAISL